MNELKLKARNAWFAALAMTAIAAILAFAAVMTVSAQSDTPDWRLPVTGLTAVAGDDPGEMIISWDAHTQTTKTFLNYRVAWTPQGERFKSADRTNWNVYTTSNQHTVTGLDAGATYQVKVRTRYEGKQGSRWTDVVTGQSAVTTNTPATGQPTIAGTVETGETLTAATSSISDDNGLANAAFAYQWIHTATDSEAYIPAATGSSYLLSSDDLGHSIKVRVTFTDDDGYTERLTSSATALVVMPANVAATGQPTITRHGRGRRDTHRGKFRHLRQQRDHERRYSATSGSAAPMAPITTSQTPPVPPTWSPTPMWTPPSRFE